MGMFTPDTSAEWDKKRELSRPGTRQEKERLEKEAKKAHLVDVRAKASEAHVAIDCKAVLELFQSSDEAPKDTIWKSVPIPDGAPSTSLMHADAPEDWNTHFPHLSYSQAKLRQLQHAFADEEDCLVWCDVTGCPPALDEQDHPDEKTEWGPYKITAKGIKGRIRSPTDFTDSSEFHRAEPVKSMISFVRSKVDMEFSNIMKILEYDNYGNPKANPTRVEQEWTMDPGWYIVLRASVTDQHGYVASDFAPYLINHSQPLQSWMTSHKLNDKVWLDVTFGSVRALALQSWEALIWRQSKLKVVAGWNCFYNLWAMHDWAQFLGPGEGSPNDISLHLDWFIIPEVLPLFERMLRHISVKKAKVADERDRDFLEHKIMRYWTCPSTTIVTYELPIRKKPWPPPKTPGQVDKVDVTTIDFSVFERYVRVTALAIFAKHFALTRCADQKASEYWFLCWEEHAERFQYSELKHALKQCRPYLWSREPDFEERIQKWFDEMVCPVLAHERLRSLILDASAIPSEVE